MEETARRAAMTDLYGLPGHLLWRAGARITRAVDEILPGNIDLHAYAVLVGLADEEPQSQRSLAARIGTSGTTLTSVALTLQTDGLVERVRNPEDRRSYSLTRTSAGRAAVRRWTPHVRRLEQRLTASFAPDEADRLRELLLLVAGDDLDSRTPQALLDSTAFLLSKAHQHAHREFLAALEPLRIEPRHYGTLRALRVVGAATQGDVAALLEVSPATVVQLVDDLEGRGLVSRERDDNDRRAYRLHLTPEADRVLVEAGAIASTMLTDRLGGPSDSSHQELVRLLRRLLTSTATA
jgi:DNA-binding MarR family transcriptional regulator